MKDLFDRNYHPTEAEVRVKERPLGPLSDYVVEALPGQLEQVRGGTMPVVQLGRESASILASVPSSVFDEVVQDSRRLDVALLDLLVAESAIVHSGGEAPTALTTRVDDFATRAGRLPTLTYEDLIFINPLTNDPRTFTHGEVGRSERDFYQGHRYIEGHFDTAIARCEHAYSVRMAASATRIIREAAAEVREVIVYTQILGMRMPKDHFAIFRQYLNTHPVRNLKGPSGVFSSGLPTLEILLAGESLPTDYYRYYLEDNFYYLPRQGRRRLQHVFTDALLGKTLANQSCPDSNFAPEREYTRAVEEISLAIRQFRGMHHRAVKHQVPQALTGEVQGTGGESDVAKFLRERMKIRYVKRGTDGN